MSKRKERGLFKRPGSPYWWVETVDPTGRRVRRSTKSTELKVARQMLAETKVDARECDGDGEHSWKEATMLWLKERSEGSRSHRANITRLRQLDDVLGGLKLRKITPAVLQKLKDKRRAAGLKPSSIRQQLAFVRAVLRFAWRELGWLKHEIPVVMPKFDNKRSRIITQDEMAALLEALPEYLQDVLRMAVLTGLRKNNVVRAQWSWVDWERELLTVPGELYKNGEDHVVPLGSQMSDLLRRNYGKHETSIFTKPNGEPLHWFNYRHWQRALKKAGISDLKLHDARRTFAMALFDAGVDHRANRELGGWKSSRVMEERYQQAAKASAAERNRKFVEAVKVPEPKDRAKLKVVK